MFEDLKAISNRALFKTQHYQLVLNAEPVASLAPQHLPKGHFQSRPAVWAEH